MEQAKTKKTIWPGIRFSLSICWTERKAIPILCALAVIMRVALPYLSILMPKIVLDQIAAKAAPERFLITVGGMALLLVAVSFIKSFTDNFVNSAIGTITVSNILRMDLKKITDMDYELIDDPGYKTVQDKADKAMHGNRSPAMNIPKSLTELLANCLGFLLYAGAIALIHPLILLLLLLTAAVNWLMLLRARRYTETTREERSKNFKKLEALNEMLRKPEAAKDIRMYGAFGWLNGLHRSQYKAMHDAERSVLSKNMHAQLTDALMILLREGAAYAFLIWLVLDGKMALGEFVFIFAAIGALAGWVSGILTAASDLSKACSEMGDIRAVFSYPDRMNRGPGPALPAAGELPPSIEMRGVGYTYPGAEGPALKDVSVFIRAGERIAVVGANGAGKTTLIKLICGLLSPTEGEILLNGKPSGAYNRDEYFSLFSAVFQDIYLLSASIAENISQKPPRELDRARVKRCLELTGLKAKTDTLPDKEDTLLVRGVHPEATELSGGEKQKLAMARALYKDAPVLILDEPTAALDPLAENEVYRKYAELTGGKTSLYISHRLASTRFCDRILLIDGSVVAEQGSHDDLMALGGVYANMFSVQASYYQDHAPDARRGMESDAAGNGAAIGDAVESDAAVGDAAVRDAAVSGAAVGDAAVRAAAVNDAAVRDAVESAAAARDAAVSAAAVSDAVGGALSND